MLEDLGVGGVHKRRRRISGQTTGSIGAIHHAWPTMFGLAGSGLIAWLVARFLRGGSKVSSEWW